jgi:hypothetical protein
MAATASTPASPRKQSILRSGHSKWANCDTDGPITRAADRRTRRRIIILVVVVIFAAWLVAQGNDLLAVTAAVAALTTTAVKAGRGLVDPAGQATCEVTSR